jgi:hypothetical protein
VDIEEIGNIIVHASFPAESSLARITHFKKRRVMKHDSPGGIPAPALVPHRLIPIPAIHCHLTSFQLPYFSLLQLI